MLLRFRVMFAAVQQKVGRAGAESLTGLYAGLLAPESGKASAGVPKLPDAPLCAPPAPGSMSTREHNAQRIARQQRRMEPHSHTSRRAPPSPHGVQGKRFRRGA
eukprot:jgi/Tetstr1/462457/TSEL_007453.t1